MIFARKVERYLDQGGMGACHLRRPEIADLVARRIEFFTINAILLREWVVMPNHVHVMVWPIPNYLVGDLVKSWKQFVSSCAQNAC